MLIDKLKNNQVWKYDTETKLYLNPITQKWTKNPRISQKGKMIGLNKGKAIGKSIGENIDKAYIDEFNELSDTYPKFSKFNLKIPKNLSNEELMSVLTIYRDSVDKYSHINIEIDNAYLILTMLIVRRLKHKTRKNYKFYGKYIQIPHTEFLKWVGVNYKFYLDAMLESKIIECDNVYYKFPDKAKALGYKINGKYFIRKDRKTPNYKQILLTNWRLKVKCFKNKINLFLTHMDVSQMYKDMTENVYKLYMELDFDKIYEYYKHHLFEFYEITNPTIKGRAGRLRRMERGKKHIYLEEYITKYKDIQEGNFFFNHCDSFGERFHSPFTNMKSVIKKWITYKEEKYVEYDIKNSQMSFFSLLFSNPIECKKILPEYTKYINEIQTYKECEDVKTFSEKALDGTLYEWIGSELNMNRLSAKRSMFHVLFSDNTKYKKLKEKLTVLLPNIIEICNKFNTDYDKMIPRLCQLLESRIVIKTICPQLLYNLEFPFITVHDSFSIHNFDEIKFITIFNNSFKQLDLPIFKLKQTHGKRI